VGAIYASLFRLVDAHLSIRRIVSYGINPIVASQQLPPSYLPYQHHVVSISPPGPDALLKSNMYDVPPRLCSCGGHTIKSHDSSSLDYVPAATSVRFPALLALNLLPHDALGFAHGFGGWSGGFGFLGRGQWVPFW
jgi:hypothetical protein